MRKVKSYTGDSYAFHEKVLAAKRNVRELKGLTDFYRTRFGEYDVKFKNDTLQKLIQAKLTAPQQKAMLNLYSFRLKPFQELFLDLTSDALNRRQNLCPNCTIETVSSLDHCIPKSEFPEFSDHPRNLMPCCMTCNSKKSRNWRSNSQRVFLNLFIDDIPDLQYLFVDSILQNGIPTFRYYIQQPQGMTDLLYERIASHYSGLDLCQRFANSSDEVLEDFHSQILDLQNTEIDHQLIFKFLSKRAKSLRERYGFNYWKAILLMHCIQKEEIFNRLLQEW